MHIVLGLLQAFIALGAMAGGFLLVKDPTGAAMGLPLSLLGGSIFTDYLIPGLFLFLVNGLGSLSGAILSFTRNRYAGEAGITLGAILVAWIIIQVSIIRSIHWLHILYFSFGIIEFVLGLIVVRARKKAA
jgi:hypothetical protein